VVIENDRDSFDNKYVIRRGFLDFLTGTLGGAAVTGTRVVFRSNIRSEFDAGYSDVHVVEGVQNIPVVVGDYGAHLSKTTSGGVILFADIGVGNANPNIITLNATGLTWINPSGLTKLCLRLISDINAWVPIGETNGVFIDWGGGWDSVVTQAATNVAGASATLNAEFRGHKSSPPFLEVVYVGANPTYPRVRFEYGETIAYGETTPWQYGTPMFTNYSAGIAGLLPSTTYQFRAQYEDADGCDYGDDETFTTLSIPALVINKAYALSRDEL